jgi:radical SAM superfamily enzyme YgiQ (UPF0313 family)
MNVLLVLPKINSGCQWNVGLAFIASVLEKEGHKIDLIEIDKYPADLEILLDQIGSFRPGVIGISANSHQFFYAKQIARDIKKKFNIPLFIGGVHTILKPQAISECEFVDGICVGEGEFSFLELVNRIEVGRDYLGIKNFWFRKNGGIVKNQIAHLVHLDHLPFPNRSIFDYFSKEGKKTPRFIFSRGCPFECAYCCNHAFKRIFRGRGQYVRWRSVDLAVKEIEETRKRYDFDYFKLDDDTFSLNRAWMKEFCQKIADKNWGLTFECNVRPGTLNEEDIKILKEAGCKMIKIGIEAGDPNLRKEIMNRNFSDSDIIRTFELAKKFGIKTFSFNIIGVPGETTETIKATIRLNRIIKPDFMQVTAFYPYSGTVLGDLCLKKGYIAKKREDSYMEKSTLELPTISKFDIEKSVKNFKFKVYWHYNKKRALQEKLFQLRKFIIKQPALHRVAKFIYRPFKFAKKRARV